DTAMALSVPVPVISEAVNARSLSARKDLRASLSEKYGKTAYDGKVMPAELRFEKLQMLQAALLQARILCYAQGFEVLQAASDFYGWNWNLGEVSQVWRAGCIIRSSLLDDIKKSYVYDRNLPNLLEANLIHSMLSEGKNALKETCIAAADNGIAAPAFSAALQYFNGYTSLSLPANLLQGMRDLFGAHTYERTDAARGEVFHTEW
ncbi:MAG: NADP-dependent phosphogluconate dehydrogenase, partial [Firmicutes bacterium]|nr:NADP-dependent phosphogluconate dehydrogenase [Bacillota bacterium]